MTVFTIGFAGKKARDFFGALAEAEVRRVIDVRLNNVSQLAGFTKRDDLKYFLEVIAGIDYVHLPELAPDRELLKAYRDESVDWAGYERVFLRLMAERHAERLLRPEQIEMACLLCSEAAPDRCHRRLVLEYLRQHWNGMEVRHL